MADFDWNKYPVVADSQTASAGFDWNKYPTIPEPSTQPTDAQKSAMGMTGGLPEQIASYPIAALSGIGEGTRQIANLATHGLNTLMSKLGMGQPLPTLPQASLSHALGIQQHPFVSSLGATIPSLALGEVAAPAELLKAAQPIVALGAAGGISGAASAQQQGQPIAQGAETGAVLGAAAGGVGAIASKAVKMAAPFIRKQLIHPLTKKGADLISAANLSTLTSPMELLTKRFQDARDMGRGWETSLLPLAQDADRNVGTASPFTGGVPEGAKAWDNSDYKEGLRQQLNKLSPKTTTKFQSKAYRPLKDALSELLKAPPTSFSESMIHRSALNAIPDTWETTNKPTIRYMRGVVHDLVDNLDNQIGKNVKTFPEAKPFADEWAKHRKNWQFLRSFEKKPVADTKGGLKLSYDKRQAESFSGDEPNEDVFKHFSPTSSDQKTLKMKHLGDLMGDDQLAAEGIKQHYLKDVYNPDDTLNLTKLLSRFGKLSDPQQRFMFSEGERRPLVAALQSRGEAQKIGRLHVLARYGTPSGVGGLTGYYLGRKHGLGFEGALGGLALGALGKGVSAAALERAFATPEGMEKLAEFSKKGLSVKAKKKISRPIAASILSLQGNP